MQWNAIHCANLMTNSVTSTNLLPQTACYVLIVSKIFSAGSSALGEDIQFSTRRCRLQTYHSHHCYCPHTLQRTLKNCFHLGIPRYPCISLHTQVRVSVGQNLWICSRCAQMQDRMALIQTNLRAPEKCNPNKSKTHASHILAHLIIAL